eukprot:scaffold320114_cov35-Tisochrysis_lutea.AAC.4
MFFSQLCIAEVHGVRKHSHATCMFHRFIPRAVDLGLSVPPSRPGGLESSLDSSHVVGHADPNGSHASVGRAHRVLPALALRGSRSPAP